MPSSCVPWYICMGSTAEGVLTSLEERCMRHEVMEKWEKGKNVFMAQSLTDQFTVLQTGV